MERFDIDEYASKAKNALAKLEQSQKPGQVVGAGSKLDVLRAVEVEIKALLDRGYTAKQLAEALKQDVFSILPKSITQLTNARDQQAGNKPKKKVARKAATGAVMEQQVRAADVKKKAQPPIAQPGSFVVKPDTKDL
ncbi:MAG: hypothetical protein ACYCSN_12145 [Acidobacteriaceae bacterium]